jgi:alpha-tubulin suppressor-like RCC1 family protein
VLVDNILLRLNRTKLYGLGDTNLYGQLGDNCAAGNLPRSSPVQIPGTNWKNIIGGYYNTYATTVTGSLYGWGYNCYGQVGDNTVLPRSSPVQIPGSNWCELGAGFYTCACY